MNLRSLALISYIHLHVYVYNHSSPCWQPYPCTAGCQCMHPSTNFENYLLRQRFHHIDCRLPLWLSGLIKFGRLSVIQLGMSLWWQTSLLQQPASLVFRGLQLCLFLGWSCSPCFVSDRRFHLVFDWLFPFIEWLSPFLDLLGLLTSFVFRWALCLHWLCI
jgi:hypothetical protein